MNSLGAISSVQQDKEQLQNILNQDEYTAYAIKEHGSLREWLKPLFRKIRSWLPDFKMSEGTADLFTLGLIVLLFAIAIFAIYWFSKQMIWQKRIRKKAYLPTGDSSRSYDYYWQQAALLRETSDWREGVRSVFLSLLFYLEEKRSIRVEKWKTNWEYTEELIGKAPSIVPLFQESSLVFERIWYGKEEVTEELFDTMYEQVAQVIGREGDFTHEKAE
ncbi:DUF4129 domain-containing protein [Paenibacillus sp. SYP-B3998]|uniref:DUF4129 domain-containing protein n=1 Tax=Paenibacillus sp. SYP-B3998 TaxID=2678564 RepID=A0A6G4A5Y6_9BACL|nr:DUF4129 domain-containing protein [Paenibacillus sp. SYP-B3998]NEW09219.1 DUF4129 domain-containing protein [Paenibacillus sp. SYP-B3998]